MLFILSPDGVPSVAQMVRLGTTESFQLDLPLVRQ